MKKKETQNEHIRKKAVEIGKIKGYEYWIVSRDGMPASEGYNGYVVFPKRPVRETSYKGVLVYVPVHGGITYCEEDSLGVVYGFDTAHCDSEKFPKNNKKWIKSQCQIMIEGILLAKKQEKDYLLAWNNKEKAEAVQSIMDLQPKQSNNFRVNINLLSGKL